MEMSGNINNLDGDAAVRYAQETERIRAARARRRWITAGIVVASLFLLMVGCGVAVGAASGPSTNANASTPAASAAPTAPASDGLHEETWTVPAPAPAATAPAPPVTTEPEPAFDPEVITEGMWAVGTEVAPGTYRSPGPLPGVVKMCYIDAKVGDEYAAQEVSDNGPVRVTVANGQTVSTSGCQPFAKVG